MVKPTTVLIADDHTMMRNGIVAILRSDPSITIVAEASNGREAVEMAAKHAPDVVLLDVAMPDLNGLEAARKIHAGDPKIAIIALSMHSDARYVTGMLDAGAMGYLLKTCDAAELFRAIEAVRRGSLFVTPDLMHVLVDRRRSQEAGAGSQTESPHTDSLTPREREVLQLVAEGLTSNEIAARLGVALKTVETHRTNTIRKLDLHSVAQLTKYAVREGLTDLTS